MNDPSRPDTIRIERVINAPRQAVFDAWLSADVLRRWWPAGADWETPVAEVEPRVGGRLRLVMRSPDGEEFGGGGEYVAIEPPERVVITWRWDGHAGHEGTQRVEVELQDRGDGTTDLVLTNTGLADDEAKRSHREGWEASFDNLERVLAGAVTRTEEEQ
ncbi:MAG TPA: SRPBCC domain-containing protein [Solirubrobacterales bacterium]|nr:SRPBCC domain-containing protein [Solirubrobacterales bacterium]